VQEISNRGEYFYIVIAMFNSTDVNIRPQEQPPEAFDECSAPGVVAAYRARGGDTESIAIDFFCWM